MKRCTKCNVEKDLEEFSKDSHQKSGVRSKCKQCCSEARRAYHLKSKQQQTKRFKAWREENPGKETLSCIRCGIEKGFDQFYKDSATKCGVRSECKKCCTESRREYLKQYYQDNKEYLNKQNKEWVKNNPEKVRVYYRNFYQNNIETERKRLRELARTPEQRVKRYRYKKAWRAANKEKEASYKAKRRTEDNLSFTSVELTELYNKYNNKCLACGSTNNLTPDHVKPLSKGGSGLISNIQPLCLSCNAAKGAKEIDYRCGEINYG